jgi:hypothetical protein
VRIAAAALVAAGCAGAAGWPSNMDGFRRDWSLSPVGAPRKGVWDCGKVSNSAVRVLAFADSAGGSVRSIDWWAESGARDLDLPDDAFWAVLDGLSSGKEWTESDPDALGASFRKGLDGPAAQGFLCRSCEPRLEAATWVSHGSTRLRVARMAVAAPKSSAPGLSAGLTGEGIRSMAAQKGLSVASSNPCRSGGGDCAIELSGPKGQRWTFRRASGAAPWTGLDASWQAGPWWSAEWNWDSLRQENRREFAEVLEHWISADADVAARNLLGPVEPVLSFPVSSWFSRTLPGVRIPALADSFSRLASPPSSFEFARSTGLRAGVDAFGRRTFSVGAP